MGMFAYDRMLRWMLIIIFISGFVNSSLYTGEIEYMDLVDSGSYWLLSLSCKICTYSNVA